MMACIVQSAFCIYLFVLHNFGANANLVEVDGLPIPGVEYPFNGSDVLSMGNFSQYVVDRDMAGVYMIGTKGSDMFNCLEWTICSLCVDNTTFYSSIKYTNTSSSQLSPSKTKYTDTVYQFEGYEDKAIFKLDNIYPKTGNVAMIISFSSHPDLYILSFICETWMEGESCPADLTIGLVTIPKESNDNNRMPFMIRDYISEDLRRNMNFDLTDLPYIFEWNIINRPYCSQ